MAGYTSMKMKRKDLEDVYDEFSDFSLSSPARKIRRLDAELPPIIEEEEPAALDLDPQPQPQPQPQGGEEFKITPTVEVNVNVNEERALVLYNPVADKSLWQPSLTCSNVSISVNRDLIPNFNNGAFWSTGPSDLLKSVKNHSESEDKNAGTNNCLAVVPWVSYQRPCAPGFDDPAMTETSEPMEAEDVGGGTMEIEQDNVSTSPSLEQMVKTNGWGQAEGLQQWQQQHCMTPQLPPNSGATPIMWSW